MLLSHGKTCYFGSIPNLYHFLTDLNMPVPKHTNPAEYILDLTNTDFKRRHKEPSFDAIHKNWQESAYAQRLVQDLPMLRGPDLRPNDAMRSPGLASQTITLLHRSLIKAIRDLFVYWIRVAMYLGLAIMMGTVWLRLSPSQEHIQSFINAIVSNTQHARSHMLTNGDSSSVQPSCLLWQWRTFQHFSKTELSS